MTTPKTTIRPSIDRSAGAAGWAPLAASPRFAPAGAELVGVMTRLQT
jgi:hypothetical protein